MRTLYIIPARAGSKGLPGKNVKLLNNKPLVQYSIEFAVANMNDEDVLCITTDDDEVLNIAAQIGIKPPFKRPDELSADTSSTYDVVLHALKHYENRGEYFDAVMLLQPTSPFRTEHDFRRVLNAFDEECDMVVTVRVPKENPYFTLYEENSMGFLNKSKASQFERRQDCPSVYAFNGSMYLIRVSSLLESPIGSFTKIKKVVMPEERSVDIDTIADWVLAEYFSMNNENS